MIYKSWVEHWKDLSEFLKYPPEIRRAIYTTNAVESLNYWLRKVAKNRSSFSTDDAITEDNVKKRPLPTAKNQKSSGENLQPR